MTDCSCCCETFNRSTRSKVECPHCDFAICKECARTYATSMQSDAHCMNCKRGWSPTFIADALNMSFLKGEYRKHRAELLLEAEMSRMPESIEAAANERRAREFDKQAEEVDAKRAKIVEQLNALDRQSRHLKHRAYRARNPHQGAADEEGQEGPKYTMGCQHPECRGFLDEKGKCALCTNHTCMRCLCVMGTEQEDIDAHECNPDDVASAQAVKRDAKPCPKCSMAISKIDGCDQMWCVGCKTAFSWRTGKIQTGVIHNPHFFEWQRNGGQEAEQAQGEAFGACNPDDIPGWFLMRRELNNIGTQATYKDTGVPLRDAMMHIYRTAGHVSRVEVADARRTVERLANTSGLRVKYLLDELSKEELGKAISLADRQRTRMAQSLQISELVETVAKECLWNFVNDRSNNAIGAAATCVEQFEQLAKYCNEEWSKLSKFHKVNMPNIVTEWFLEGGQARFLAYGKKKY